MFSGDWPEQPGQPFTPSHPHLGTHLSFALLEVGSCPLTCAYELGHQDHKDNVIRETSSLAHQPEGFLPTFCTSYLLC